MNKNIYYNIVNGGLVSSMLPLKPVYVSFVTLYTKLKFRSSLEGDRPRRHAVQIH